MSKHAKPHAEKSADGAAEPRETRTLSLQKGTHEFRFRYAAGEEKAVLDALLTMVGDKQGQRPDGELDWFDAAVLSHQLGGHLAKELSAMMPKKAA